VRLAAVGLIVFSGVLRIRHHKTYRGHFLCDFKTFLAYREFESCIMPFLNDVIADVVAAFLPFVCLFFAQFLKI